MVGGVRRLARLGPRPDRRKRPPSPPLHGPQGQSLAAVALADRAPRGESRDASPRPSLGIPPFDGPHPAATRPDRLLPPALIGHGCTRINTDGTTYLIRVHPWLNLFPQPYTSPVCRPRPRSSRPAGTPPESPRVAGGA